MLAIRMQRTGRKGHAMFRLIVQDSRRTPTSGNVVALLGNYDPHSKAIVLDKEKASFYLEHGAQPSGRTAILLRREGVKLPAWVVINEDKKGKPRHEKRVKEQPSETPAALVAEAPEEAVEPTQETAPASEQVTEQETVSDVVADEAIAEDAPAEEAVVEAEPSAEAAEETPVEEPSTETTNDTTTEKE